MPRLNAPDDSSKTLRIGGGGFTFTATRIEHLGATEYTLVEIAVDVTGSVAGFQDELKKMLVTAVEACKRCPRFDNILARVILFSDQFPKGVEEIHGFKPVSEIDTNAYPDLKPGGWTPLNDACYSVLGSTNKMAEELSKQDYGCNAIVFIITDGGENSSTTTTAMVKAEAEKAITSETLESLISVLIGINVSGHKDQLENFQREAGLTQFIDAGEATPRKLAKLAAFVSQSVSSQSQALGKGGPSQNIAPTI